MGAKLLETWRLLKNTKLGRWLYSIILGIIIPYSGSIGSRVESLESGACTLTLKEKRAVRNHLRSVHAIALANVSELASGLAMVTSLSKNTRSIVTNIEIEYLKKARGVLRVEGTANPPKEITEKTECFAFAEIFDETGELISKTKVTWLLDENK